MSGWAREEVVECLRWIHWWRWKREGDVKPRIAASEARWVKPKHTSLPGFPEVPQHLLEAKRWTLLHSAAQKKVEEGLMIKKFRGTLWCMVHHLRKAGNRDKEVLFGRDNMSNILRVEKGCSADSPMCFLLRRWAASCLAGNIQARKRWIPLERNPSDHASR